VLMGVVVPAGRYARSLRVILHRARRAKVLPPASMAPSRAASPAPDASGAGQRSSWRSTLDPTSSGTGAAPGSQPLHRVDISTGPIVPPLENARELFDELFALPISGPPSHEAMITPGVEYPNFDFLLAPESLERVGIHVGDDMSLPL
jgi:hypothetical protein